MFPAAAAARRGNPAAGNRRANQRTPGRHGVIATPFPRRAAVGIGSLLPAEDNTRQLPDHAGSASIVASGNGGLERHGIRPGSVEEMSPPREPKRFIRRAEKTGPRAAQAAL